MGRRLTTIAALTASLCWGSCLPDWPPPGLDDDTTAGDDDATGDDDTTGDDDDTGDDDTGDDDTVTSPPPWVSLAGRSYEMGSDTGEANEQPVHLVTVADFEIHGTEVTVEQYRGCVDDGTCSAPSENDEWCHWYVADREQYPVNCVTWTQAADYCKWLGARLPSEAEWEFAARSRGAVVLYPWGDEPATCDRAVMDDPAGGGNGCGTSMSWEVCSRSPAGDTDHDLCDMAGNVWEWVADLYHDSYVGAPQDGSVWEDGGTPNPVTRGGSSGNEADNLTNTFRDWAEPDTSIPGLGFRCARTPE